MQSDRPLPNLPPGQNYHSSCIVFVGNIPFGLSETQIIEIFSAVGRVICFRLVFDRETGRSKGYGFAEYADDETAACAVRNLDNYEIMGRKLRVDYSSQGHIPDAPPPPFVLIPDLPKGMDLPQGISATEAISRTLDAIPPTKLMEVLAQMHDLAVKEPSKVTELLKQAPQLSYALFEVMVKTGHVDQAQMTRYLESIEAPLRTSVPPRGFGTESRSRGSSAEPRSYVRTAPPIPLLLPIALPLPQHNPPSPFHHQVPQAPPPVRQAVPPPPPPVVVPESNFVLLQQVMNLPMDQIVGLPDEQMQQLLQLRQRLTGEIMREVGGSDI